MRKSCSSLLSCPSALGSLRPGLPSDFLSFGHTGREAAHARLGSSKVPQPGVDLVNMAAPPLVKASTIGTAALRLKSVPLSAAVLGIVEVAVPSRKHGTRGTRLQHGMAAMVLLLNR